MMNLPVRKAGQYGVITDLNPYDLPPNAYSNANNVLFDEDKVLRAPVYKRLFNVAGQGANETGAASAFSYTNEIDGAVPVIGFTNNDIKTYNNGTEADVTPAGKTTATLTKPYTHAQLSGLSLIGRESMKPYIRDLTSSAAYALLSVGDWPANDTARSWRAFKDFFIALNVNEAGTQKDTMVKWSDIVQFRANPSSGVVWTAGASNSAGSNILAQMRTGIVDGSTLANSFVIYSETESVLMDFTGSSDVFSFKNLFDDDGVINPNCIASTGKEHYVFGNKDIYMHNGITKKSVAQGRVRRRIYQGMSEENKEKCFVHFDKRLDLIYFCYVSNESDIGFVNTNYCNRAAIYNVRYNTWSFVDLPNVFGGGLVNVSLADQSYASSTPGYNATDSAYETFEDSSPRSSFFASARMDTVGLTSGRVYAPDLLVDGLIQANAEPETLKPAFIERLGLDLDETKAPLRSYKNILAFIPQITTISGEDPVTVSLGATDLPYVTDPNYQTVVSFAPSSAHKIDSRAAGRLIAFRVTESAGKYFNYSGGDFEISITSTR